MIRRFQLQSYSSIISLCVSAALREISGWRGIVDFEYHWQQPVQSEYLISIRNDSPYTFAFASVPCKLGEDGRSNTFIRERRDIVTNFRIAELAASLWPNGPNHPILSNQLFRSLEFFKIGIKCMCRPLGLFSLRLNLYRGLTDPGKGCVGPPAYWR